MIDYVRALFFHKTFTFILDRGVQPRALFIVHVIITNVFTPFNCCYLRSLHHSNIATVFYRDFFFFVARKINQLATVAECRSTFFFFVCLNNFVLSTKINCFPNLSFNPN